MLPVLVGMRFAGVHVRLPVVLVPLQRTVGAANTTPTVPVATKPVQESVFTTLLLLGLLLELGVIVTTELLLGLLLELGAIELLLGRLLELGAIELLLGLLLELGTTELELGVPELLLVPLGPYHCVDLGLVNSLCTASYLCWALLRRPASTRP
jgi:hypothetical protein